MANEFDFTKNRHTWIVAEIGVNHEGDSAIAEKMIHQAAKAGADAVKFQTFRAEHYVSTIQPERCERARGFELEPEEFRRLADVSKEAGVVFFSTPLHANDVKLLNEIAPIFKVSSGDLTHLALLRTIAETGKPIILSTGLGTEEEIATAVATIESVRPDVRDRNELVLLHCVAAYPTPYEEANLRNIRWMSERFGYPTGYSDHTLGIKAAELAVAAGAVAIEKHFTYRKEEQDFHDHHISADPNDMADLVSAIRQAEVLLGNHERARTPSELKGLEHMRRSIGAAREIKAGQPITVEDLTYLRPMWGLPSERFNDIIGATLNRNVAAGDLLKEEDVVA